MSIKKAQPHCKICLLFLLLHIAFFFSSLGFKKSAKTALYRSSWLPDKFSVNLPFGSREQLQYRFSRWWPWDHLGFSVGTILAIFFIYKSLRYLPMKSVTFQIRFKSIGLSIKEKKIKIFSTWLPWQSSWIFEWNVILLFWSTTGPNTSYQISGHITKTRLFIYTENVTTKKLCFQIKILIFFIFMLKT